MISKLNLYLNGAMSYQEACSIFFKYSKNKILATNLLKRENDSNSQKLKYEIKKLISENKIAPEVIPSITNELLIKKSIEIDFKNNTQNNPIQQKVIDKRNQLYRERGHLHGRLHEANTNESRKEIATEIITIQKTIDDLNRDLRLIETGEIPSKYIKTVATAEDYLEVRNAKMYIARYQKKLSSCGPEEKNRYLKLIDKYQAKIKSK